MDGAATFLAAMRVCDPDLDAHAGRVRDYATAIAVRLGWDDDQLDALRLGAALHDVGKLNVRPELLGKTGPLTDSELTEIRAHPVEGVWLIAGVRSLAPAIPYVLFHHERWEGGGYPTARSGTDIPLEGRILAIADALDAMISDRPYREALSWADAIEEIGRCAGEQFDPHLAQVFVDAVDAGDVTPYIQLAVVSA